MVNQCLNYPHWADLTFFVNTSVSQVFPLAGATMLCCWVWGARKQWCFSESPTREHRGSKPVRMHDWQGSQAL